MILVFLFMISLGIYAYLFSVNPLANTSLLSIMNNGLSIKINDRNNLSIFSLENKSPLKENNILTSNLKNALLSIHYILDGAKDTCSPLKKQNINNSCQFYYTNILANNYLLNNLFPTKELRITNNQDLFFKIKKYIVLNWLRKNFSENKFFQVMFNYSYFGNGIIGINQAAYKYFGVNNLNNLTTIQSILLAKKLFDNNTFIYEDAPNANLITTNNIINTMYKLGYISYNEFQKIKSDSYINIDNFNDSNLYQIYSSSIISDSFYNITTTNNIIAFSTLDKNVQYNLSETINDILLNQSIPGASILIMKKGNIIAGFNTSLYNNKSNYYSYYPDVRIKTLLRPLLYLSLMKEEIRVPKTLYNQDVQNVITEQMLSPYSLNTKLFPEFSKNVSSSDSGMTELNTLANQLVGIENTLFNKVSKDDFYALLNSLYLPIESYTYSSNDKEVKANFKDIVNSFSVLNQNGLFVSPLYVTKIVNKEYVPNISIKTSLDTSNNLIILNNIFRKVTTNQDISYRVVFDKNVAIAYYKDYTIGVWFGNMKSNADQNFNKNSYQLLENSMSSLINTLADSLSINNNKVNSN